MSHKMLRPFIVKVSVLGYIPLYIYIQLSVSRTTDKSDTFSWFGCICI